MDDQQMVLKLKKKLKDAIEAGREEDYVLKVLHRLSELPMTIEILQNTQIGKDVNGLRKLSGRIKTESKALVLRWKKLLPSAEPDSTSQHNHKTSTSAHQTTPHTSTSYTEADSYHRDSRSLESKYRSSSSKRKSRIKTESGRDAASSKSMDGFSKALLGEKETQSNEDPIDCLELDFPSIAGESSFESHSSRRVAHVPKCKDLNPKKLAVKKRSISPNPIRSSPDMSCHSSGLSASMLSSGHLSVKDSSQTPPRKRRADMVGGLDSVALSKRSRTQVYSGKKALSGPQFVPSLFDTCIKVLIDNVDVIEDVGGVPFFVLEPVLSRCTAAQLLRLEEFNPHFVEDSDGLWEKHCLKEFRGAKPIGHQTWRELYIDKLEDREMKLKSLTARISATQKARQEPIRKVMSTVATRQPGRRGTRSVPFFPGRSSTPLESKTKARPLMKQTMKMAQQRNSMMRSKPGH